MRTMTLRIPTFYVWWSMFVLSMGVSGMLIFSPLFAVQNVSCSYTNGKVCGDQVVEVLWYETEGRIWLVHPDAVRARIESLIHDATVADFQVHWGDRSVSILLEPIEPVVYVVTSDARQGYALGPDGSVLGIVDGLPEETDQLQVVIADLIPYAVGQQADALLYGFAVDLANAVSLYGMRPDTVLALSDDEVILAKGEKRGILSAHKDAYEQAWALQLILTGSSANQTMPIIDVRFDQPVLKPYR